MSKDNRNAPRRQRQVRRAGTPRTEVWWNGCSTRPVPGPEIPEGGADRIKAAIRPSWQGRGRGRGAPTQAPVGRWPGRCCRRDHRRGRRARVAARQRPITRQTPSRWQWLDGGLEITPPGSTVSFLGPDDAGIVIPDGSLVRTRRDHRAALRLTGGQSLRLDDDTVIRLDSERSISLDSGAVYISSADGCRSRHRGADRPRHRNRDRHPVRGSSRTRHPRRQGSRRHGVVDPRCRRIPDHPRHRAVGRC